MSTTLKLENRSTATPPRILIFDDVPVVITMVSKVLNGRPRFRDTARNAPRKRGG